MSKITELNASIAKLNEELHYAEEDHAKAVESLINTPEARNKARSTEKQCADLRADIALLDTARAAALAHAQSPAAKAIKQKGLAHLGNAERLSAARNAAAAAIDKALAELDTAARAWVESSSAMKSEVVGFYRIAFEGNQHAALSHIIMLGGLEKAIGNTLGTRIDNSLRGLNLGAVIAFQYQHDFNAPTPLAADDSKKSGESIIRVMTHTAATQGLTA